MRTPTRVRNGLLTLLDERLPAATAPETEESDDV